MVGGGLHEPVYSAAWPTGGVWRNGVEDCKLGFKRQKRLKAIQKERNYSIV